MSRPVGMEENDDSITEGGWKREAERLRDMCRRQQDEIETLNDMADAVEALRDIGRVTGCDHVDGPDGRRQLVNCVEQTICQLRQVVAAFRENVQFPIGQGRDDCDRCYGIGLVGTDGTACVCVRMATAQ